MFAHSPASKKSLIQLGHSQYHPLPQMVLTVSNGDIGCLKAKPRGLTRFPTLHA